MMKRVLAGLVCLMLCVSGFIPAVAETDTQDSVGRVQALLDEILACQLQRAGVQTVQEWIDGELTQNAGRGSEWMIFALAQSGSYDFSAYRAALLTYLENAGGISASTRQKYALILLATGGVDDYVQTSVQETIGQQGVMSWVYGLHLLNNGCTGDVTAQQAVDTLLDLRLEDGGWALRGTVSDVDVTAMTIQALAPYTSEEKVKTALDGAVEVLAQRQMENGDFASFGAANPESAAQVMMALAALGIDALEDERFIRQGNDLLDVIERFRLEDGGFCHVTGGPANLNASVQVMHALLAWQLMINGEGRFYDIEPAQPVQQMTTALDYKAVASLIIAGAAIVACAVLFAMGKRSAKNWLAVVIIAAALILFVQLTEFQSADSYYSMTTTTVTDPIGRVTMSIRCDTALGKTDVDLPADGVMLAETAFDIGEEDTPYDLLTRAAKEYGIRLDTSGAQGMIYVSGINYLYEFACGDLSGWVYMVNGERSGIGCDQYKLADGDVVEWRYSCELGNDLK